MPDFSEYDSAYIAFDPYPSYKGSATHITEVYQTLRSHSDNSLLISLLGVSEPSEHHWVPDLPVGNYLQRGMAFGQQIRSFIQSAKALQLVHYRDIWGGLAISEQPHIKGIFEVNGFPSIELKERYPILPKKTIGKIDYLEKKCLHASDQIICPSAVIADHLISKNIDPGKIEVIPNGTNFPDELELVSGLPANYMVYFGALQPWQGINIAIKAFRYLADLPDLKLVICSSHKEKLSRPLKKFIRNGGFEDRVIWKYQLTKPQLHHVVSKAIISLAPLTECERNLIQGCSPLKIYESMACQTAIVASDLPVVREILTQGEDALLVRPDRPADLARAIRRLCDDTEMRNFLAENAYRKVIEEHGWDRSNRMLSKIYQQYFITEPI